MHFRTWLRNLTKDENLNKISDEVKEKPHNSTFLISKIKERYPDINKKSASASFVEAWKKQINEGISYKNLLEIYGLIQKLFENGIRNYPKSDASIQRDYKLIRAEIIKMYGKESREYQKSLTKMQFDRTKWRSNREEYQKMVAENNKNQTEVEESKIIEVVDKIKDSTDYIDLAILCELCSGSRSVEILDLSTFKKSKKDNYIVQMGIAKQKNKPEEIQRELIEKPILFISVSKFLENIKTIREKLKSIKRKYKNSYEISQSQNAKINRRIKKLFDEDFSSHDLRKIYGAISYEKYAPDNTSKSAWLSDKLGHQPGSLTVAQSYSTVNVSKKVEEEEEEG